MALIQPSYDEARNNRLNTGLDTSGGWLGKNSVASEVGNALGWHPTKPAEKDAAPAVLGTRTERPADSSPLTPPKNNGNVMYGPPAPDKKVIGDKGQVTSKTSSKLAQQAENIKIKNAKRAQEDAIGRNWDNADGYVDDTSTAVDELGKQQSRLGEARDAMLGAFDNKLNAQKKAIAGNRELTTRNQTKDLSNLAQDMRKSIFNSNISLGAASGGSAGQLFSKAIQETAGKNRANILTGYGDQISQANQDEQNANDTYQTNRKAAYDWEERNKQDIITKFNAEKATLDRLRGKVPDWKKNDIDALSEANLQKLISGLQLVSQEAKNYRDGLTATINTYKDAATAVGNEAINIDAPAALDTPQFNEQLNIAQDGQINPDATSFTNPNVTGKKQVGTDIFGNPLYDDGTTGN